MPEVIDVEVLPPTKREPWQELRTRPGCGLLIWWFIIAFGLEVFDAIPGLFDLDFLGIRPRSAFGLIGVFTWPWLHGGFGHLFANAFPFFVLGRIVMAAEGRRFVQTSALLVLLSGLGVWVLGATGSTHIGASGLVYGYFGYVISRAWHEKRAKWTLLGILIAVVYGGLIFGVFPQRGVPISWEGHLCGLLAGFWLGKRSVGFRD